MEQRGDGLGAAQRFTHARGAQQRLLLLQEAACERPVAHTKELAVEAGIDACCRHRWQALCCLPHVPALGSTGAAMGVRMTCGLSGCGLAAVGPWDSVCYCSCHCSPALCWLLLSCRLLAGSLAHCHRRQPVAPADSSL